MWVMFCWGVGVPLGVRNGSRETALWFAGLSQLCDFIHEAHFTLRPLAAVKYGTCEKDLTNIKAAAEPKNRLLLYYELSLYIIISNILILDHNSC